MKKLFVLILLFGIIFSMFSQFSGEEDWTQILKKGDTAEFDGVLMSKQKAEKIVKDLEELKKLKEKEVEYNKIIDIFGPQLVDEKGTEISIIRTYYKGIIDKLEKENKQLRITNKILIITNSIGWSLVVGETSGFAVAIALKWKF